jgi:hypothetical protein
MWLKAFARLGCAVTGVDGPHVPTAQLAFPADRFVARDLTKPLGIEGSWDLSISLEVAEHLPPDLAESFVADLAALAPLSLFSAAIPLQGGVHHVNEQWPGYWVDLFARHEMVPIDCIRPIVWEDERIEWWYAQNILLFVKDSLAVEYPRLARLHQEGNGRVMPLVHPRLHLESDGVRAAREAGAQRDTAA